MSLAALAFTVFLAPVQKPESQEEKNRVYREVPQRRFQLKSLKKATVTIKGHKFHLWIMDTYSKREEGMMFLENTDFRDDEGMIFVFKDPDYQRFWMMNTLVPLDIAYVGKGKKIINTYTMKARDTTTDYSSFGPANLVIELRAGILKKHSIGKGEAVEVPKDLKAQD